jgi:hypothetical protein
MVRTSPLPAMLPLVFAVLITGPFAAPAGAQEDKSFDLPRAVATAPGHYSCLSYSQSTAF